MNLGLAVLMKDGYKSFHASAYHPEVTEVVSNFTPRNGKHSNIPQGSEVIHFGTQFFIKEVLGNMFKEQFFNLTKEEVVSEYKRVMESYLMHSVDTTIFEKLHDLGYLPLEVRSLPEGSLVPYQVPVLTIRNTHPDFAWLPNMLETVLSTYLWPLMTSATTAFNYLKETKRAFSESGTPDDLLMFMCHDFSFRGMMGLEAAALSGAGHLTSFAGTDTIPAGLFMEQYYNAQIDKELVMGSVDATEHSVTCSWIEEGETVFLDYLMEEASPSGILSVVADTWDFWNFVTEILPSRKEQILSREGKVVVRPDSGDPVDILCGDELTVTDCEKKGLIEVLWDIFGGTVTEKGYKRLDSHIGAIYGDSITLERQRQISDRLMAKGFAPEVVLGIGSYSYQYVTRDTHGSAMKATNVVKSGKSLPIFKDPKTDQSKKSAKGLIKVAKEDGVYKAYDNQTDESFYSVDNELEVVYLNGDLVKEVNLQGIRKLIHSQAKDKFGGQLGSLLKTFKGVGTI